MISALGKKIGLSLFLLLVILTGTILAQGNTTYVVQGTHYGPPSTGVVVMGFMPDTVQVHRGDTVEWHFDGVHIINTGSSGLEVVVPYAIDGELHYRFNPLIVNATLENGGIFKPDATSGFINLSDNGETFSLVMDVEPGTYEYHTDLNPEMTGTIVVVADDEVIPTPEEVAAIREAFINEATATGLDLLTATLGEHLAESEDGLLEVQIGASVDRSQINYFFPPIATVNAGDTVTWIVAEGRENYTINFPAPAQSGSELSGAIEPSDEAGETVYLLNDRLLETTESGAEVLPDSVIQSGILNPGDTFSLSFPESGIYTYYSAIQNVRGAIVVRDNN